MMEWYNIIVLVLGAVGGTGGIISIYTAHAKKTSIEIENLRNVLEEERTANEGLLARMKGLEELVDVLNKRDLLKMRAINAGWRCKFPADVSECPVIQTLRDECGKNENVCIVD